MSESKHLVAVIGAGPAGLYAARLLATSGTDVVLFNRDIKPERGELLDRFRRGGNAGLSGRAFFQDRDFHAGPDRLNRRSE